MLTMTMPYRLGLYEKSMPNDLALAKKLLLTRQSGFDYLELSIDETDEKLARLDWDEETLPQLESSMHNTGVPIHSICLSGHRKYPMGHPDPAVRARSMEIMEKAIRLASRLNIRLIQLAGYDVYYLEGSEQTRELFARNLRKAAHMAAAYGVMLAFETMETPFMNTVEKAMRYVHSTQSAWLQVYPDSGNLTNAAGGNAGRVLADLDAGRGHLAALHLKETVPGVFREVPFGTGHVDFTAIARKAYELDVRTFVGEFWYTGSDHWREDLASANRFLRDHLNHAVQ